MWASSPPVGYLLVCSLPSYRQFIPLPWNWIECIRSFRYNHRHYSINSLVNCEITYQKGMIKMISVQQNEAEKFACKLLIPNQLLWDFQQLSNSDDTFSLFGGGRKGWSRSTFSWWKSIQDLLQELDQEFEQILVHSTESSTGTVKNKKDY